MFGHRVAVLLRLPLHHRQIVTGCLHSEPGVANRVLSYQAVRTYATPGRPRKAVGEPSKPVKRAVKRAAAKATTTSELPAKTKSEGTKAEGRPKAAVKARPKAKSKAKAKPKAAKKPKRVLSEEQKQRNEARAESLKVRGLKKQALTPPTVKKGNAFSQFLAERSKQNGDLNSKGPVEERRQRLAESTRAAAAAWKESAAADIEHYNHLANTAKQASQAEYKRWVESHTPEEIQEANRARRSLRTKLEKDRKSRTKSKWPAIHDERAAKRPSSAFIKFSVSRNGSGDLKNISVAERSKLIGQEWKALNEEEKHKYQNLFQEEHKRYVEDYSNVYGHPPGVNNDAQLSAAAA